MNSEGVEGIVGALLDESVVELEVSSGRSGVSQTLFSLNFSTRKVLALELRFESGTFPKMFFPPGLDFQQS